MNEPGLAKTKVLLAGHLPPPMGGIASYYQNLLSSSLPKRIKLKFVQTSTQNRELSQSGRFTILNFFDALKDCNRFLMAVLSHRPQICHIGTAFGLSFLKHSICIFIARFFGSRVLIHPHCSLSALYFDRSKWWRWIFCQVIRLSAGVIALSSEWQQILEIAPGSRVYLLQNAINLTSYQTIAQSRFENSRQDDDVVILYLGYIGKAKGSFDLLKAARVINSKAIKACFNLAGDELRPGELDHLQREIVNAKLNHMVKIQPPVIDEEKLAVFREADIFVYPSYSEGLPMAVIEAMASGLPIVATHVGGLPDLVREGVNGILVEPGCPTKLATALGKFILDPQLRHTMGTRSSQIASEEYDIEQHVLKLVDIYAKTLQVF